MEKITKGKKDNNFESSLDKTISDVKKEIEKNYNYFIDQNNKVEEYFTPLNILDDPVNRVKTNFNKFLMNYK